MTRPWFKVARGIHDHPRFARVELCEVACATWLFDHARHTPGDGLDVGQLRATYTDLVRAWRWERRGARPEEMVRRLLRRWSSDPDPMIEFAPEVVGGAKVGIVITVLRYADWQGPKGVRRATDPSTDLQGDHPTDPPTDVATDLNPTYAKRNPATCDGPADGRRDGPADGPRVGPSDDLLLTRDDLRRETVETRAGARDPHPSLPGLESPEGVDGCIGPSPTSPAATPASHTAAGVGPGAVERRSGATPLGVRVRQTWMAVHRERVRLEMPRPDATRSYRPSDIDEVTRTVAQLAESVGDDAAIETWRRIVERYHADEGRNGWLRDKGWPLGALVTSWDQYAREPKAKAKGADPADPHGWASFVPDEFDEAQDRIFDEMMRRQREDANARQ